MLTIIFVVVVILAFGVWFLATWPPPYTERIARGLFLLAAIIWAFTQLGGGGVAK
jgi:hypothetical protein